MLIATAIIGLSAAILMVVVLIKAQDKSLIDSMVNVFDEFMMGQPIRPVLNATDNDAEARVDEIIDQHIEEMLEQQANDEAVENLMQSFKIMFGEGSIGYWGAKINTDQELILTRTIEGMGEIAPIPLVFRIDRAHRMIIDKIDGVDAGFEVPFEHAEFLKAHILVNTISCYSKQVMKTSDRAAA